MRSRHPLLDWFNSNDNNGQAFVIDPDWIDDPAPVPGFDPVCRVVIWSTIDDDADYCREPAVRWIVDRSGRKAALCEDHCALVES